MSGRLVGIVLLLSAIVAGAALYYMQVHGFYRELPGGPTARVELVLRDGGTATLEQTGFRAIDADSSPIRYRACFTTPEPFAEIQARFQPYEDEAIPRNAPGWFDCFDAAAIAEELARGDARVFLGQKNIAYGVDRIVALTRDGRGFVWHELNECGEKAYDGTVVGEACPPRP